MRKAIDAMLAVGCTIFLTFWGIAAVGSEIGQRVFGIELEEKEK